MAATIPHTETREIQFQALVYINGHRTDNTSLAVEVAFVPPRQTPSAWLTGSWARAGRGTYTVAAGALTRGLWDMWARVDGQAAARLGGVCVT